MRINWAVEEAEERGGKNMFNKIALHKAIQQRRREKREFITVRHVTERLVSRPLYRNF